MSDAGKLHLAKTYQPKEQYLSLQEDSLRDPESFWAKIAGQLVWHRKWDKVLKWDPPFARWLVGGTLNAAENAVARHWKSWRKNTPAYLWEGEPGEPPSPTSPAPGARAAKVTTSLQNLTLRR